MTRMYMQAFGSVRGKNTAHPLHLIHPFTKRSYCQTENNPTIIRWRKFDKIESAYRYGTAPEQLCKNCVQLIARVHPDFYKTHVAGLDGGGK